VSTDSTPQARPITAFLHEHRQGLTHSELSEALAEVTRRVLEHRKPGSLTLKLDIKPGPGASVEVADKITVKAPQGQRESSLFFSDEHGNLSRKDPRQLELGDQPLRTVPRPEAREA
jgi:hypothetical protein